MLKTLMSSQQLYHRLEEHLQFSQDSSLSPAVVFPSSQNLGQDCRSYSRLECCYDEDQSLHHQSWVLRIQWTAVLGEDDALELHRKEIPTHIKVTTTLGVLGCI